MVDQVTGLRECGVTVGIPSGHLGVTACDVGFLVGAPEATIGVEKWQ